jgi:beta-phosphoglucomutase family hydrolase
VTITLSAASTGGAVFDMDGVVTSTARLHERAWKSVFDRILAEAGDERPFTHEDYRAHVDGRIRADGVRTFLASRAIPADEALVERIADEKNALFVHLLETEGAIVLPGARELLAALRGARIGVGLFTASRNADRVLASTKLSEAFDARVDGNTAAAEGLAGKPAPDLPLACAARLGVPPSRCALFEDAVPGIEAGRAGGFRHVIGIASGADAERLTRAGAEGTVPSLAGIRLAA